MAIQDWGLDRFKESIAANLTPAKPISHPEYLRGRTVKLKQIDRAFASPGKHIFIYGDRGVGKTSLAQTAAVIHQSADADPLLLACDQQTKFFDLARDIAKACVPPQSSDSHKLSVGIPGLSYEYAKSIDHGMVPEVSSINDAILLLKYVSQHHSKAPVVIIDEFDQLQNPAERKYVADLIKQLSDQNVNLRLILCGIGASLEELLGVHMSTGRYLAPIELERLPYDACWEIIETAAKDLGVVVDYETNMRIGLISDGFPYYVHLIGESIFWAMFDDSETLTECKSRHFESGVKGAVHEATPTLKFAYDKATQKYKDDYDYQEVLWAVADKPLLRRQITDIFEASYQRIMKERLDREPLDKDRFRQRMHNLTTDRHGHILVKKGAGWYEYKENIVRGYVRLKAQEHGVELGKDYYVHH